MIDTPENKNIVTGVKKNGIEITIVIRPTDRGKVIFHNEEETTTLI